MQRAVTLLLLCAAFATGYSYWRSSRTPKSEAAEQSQEAETTPAAQEGDPAIKVAGPLTELMKEADKVLPGHKPDPVSKTYDARYVGHSPVGTSSVILHKTFAVTAAPVNFPFEIPAYAARPQLRGSYRSFVKQLAVQPDEDIANVDFLIFKEDQYADFLRGHGGETLFTAESSHDQNVNVGFPPTQDHPQKYYIVFRNTPGGAARKLVQADLTVDF